MKMKYSEKVSLLLASSTAAAAGSCAVQSQRVGCEIEEVFINFCPRGHTSYFKLLARSIREALAWIIHIAKGQEKEMERKSQKTLRALASFLLFLPGALFSLISRIKKVSGQTVRIFNGLHNGRKNTCLKRNNIFHIQFNPRLFFKSLHF